MRPRCTYAASEPTRRGRCRGRIRGAIDRHRGASGDQPGAPGTVGTIVNRGWAHFRPRDQCAIEWRGSATGRSERKRTSPTRLAKASASDDVRDAVDSGARHFVGLVRLPRACRMTIGRGPLCRGMRSLAEAELARASGRDGAADWSTAADVWAASRPDGADLEGYARWRAGTRLLETRGAECSCGSAVAIDPCSGDRDRVEGAPLRTDVERVAARAHLSLTDTEAVRGAYERRLDLTPRELEVLELVASGQSNREIGEALFIAEKTAGVHVSNVLGKLGVARRTEAVAVARNAACSRSRPDAPRGGCQGRKPGPSRTRLAAVARRGIRVANGPGRLALLGWRGGGRGRPVDRSRVGCRRMHFVLVRRTGGLLARLLR